MKSELFLYLDKGSDRPILELKDVANILVLLDTGARFPVWTSDVDSLTAMGGTVFRRDIAYSGVGGETKGDIYIIPSFHMSDGVHHLIYPNLPIVTNTNFESVPFQMILSATMFHNLEYTINDKQHSLIIRVPDDESEVRNAVIRSDDESFQVLFA